MEYKKAAQIRKKGLFELISENKFSKEKSIGASIGGAISDKMKAKAVGIKEKFDPLNMVKALTGDGFIGKSIRTVAGRAMVRSEEHIRHFGGYGSRKRKLKETKDPLFTTIGSGAIVKIKSGDSISNILAKMYRFMEKNHETRRLNTELEDAFRKEQLEEEERRHKKLIEALTGKKTETAKPEDDDSGKSFFEKLLAGIKGALSLTLGPIITAIAFLKNKLSKLVENAAKMLLGPVLENLKPLIKTLLEGIVRSILNPKVLVGLIAIAAAEYFKFEKITEKNDSTIMRRSSDVLPGTVKTSSGAEFTSKGTPVKLGGDNLLRYKKEVIEKLDKGELKLYDVFLPGTNQRQFLPLNETDAQYLKERYYTLAGIPNVIKDLQNKSDPASIEKLRSLRDLESDTTQEVYKVWQNNLSEKFSKPDEDLTSFIDNKIKYPDKGRFGGKIAAMNEAVENFINEKTTFTSPKVPIPATSSQNLPTANDTKSIPESAPTKNIPELLPNNFEEEGESNKPSGTLNVYGNNSQNTIGGGPAKMVDGSSTPVRNLALQKHFRPAVV